MDEYDGIKEYVHDPTPKQALIGFSVIFGSAILGILIILILGYFGVLGPKGQRTNDEAHPCQPGNIGGMMECN